MAKEPRLILSVAESERLIADHISLGENYGDKISKEEYDRWHRAGKTILSRIFDTREIPKQFDGTGAGASAFSDSNRPELSSAWERLQREIEFLESLKGNLKRFRLVPRALR